MHLLGTAVVGLALLCIILSILRIVVYQRDSVSDDTPMGRLVGFIRETVHVDLTLPLIFGGFLLLFVGMAILALGSSVPA